MEYVLITVLVTCSLMSSVMLLFSYDMCMDAQRPESDSRRQRLQEGDESVSPPHPPFSAGGQAILTAVLVIGLLGLVVFLPWQFGAISRGEVSALPWVRYSQEYGRHGIGSSLMSVAINLIYLMWALVLPAHLAVKWGAELVRELPFLPHVLYVLNVLLGIVICSPHNFVYELIE